MIEVDADYKKFENSLLKEIKEMYDREIRNETRNHNPKSKKKD